MRFKSFYLKEAPISYDDSHKIGSIDKETNTKWGKPPSINANYTKLDNWVNERIKQNVLTGKVMQGATKRVMFNDGKTMFKWVYDNSYGNQIGKEVKISKQFGTKYKNLLPKIFDSGKYWMIQEYAKPITKEEFVNKVGINYVLYNKVMEDVTDLLTKFVMKSKKPITTANLNKVHDKIIANKQYRELGDERTVYDNKFVLKLLDFSRKTGSMFTDFNYGNFGTINNRLVLIDYGI